MTETRTSVSSRSHGKKYFHDIPFSSEDATAQWEAESHAETRSASFGGNKEIRDRTPALLSRSLDGASRASSSARSSTAKIGTGRPLARRRRVSPRGYSEKTISGGILDRRPETTTSNDSVTFVPRQPRYLVKDDAPQRPEDARRLRKLTRDVPPANLKRITAGPSDRVGTGGCFDQTLLSSSILSPRKMTYRGDRSQPRPTQSVRFSRIEEKSTPRNKGRRAGSVALRSTTPIPKTGTRSRKTDHSDDSSSSNIRELRQQTPRRNVKRSKGSADLLSRRKNPNKSPSKSRRSSSGRESGPGGRGSTTKDEQSTSRHTTEKLSTSSETSCGSSSLTSSTSSDTSSSSLGSGENVGDMAGMMPQTSKARERKSVGSQTVDSSTTARQRGASRGSQMNLKRSSKRLPRSLHTSRQSSSRVASTVSSPQAVQPRRQTTQRPPVKAFISDANGKVSRSTSPILITCKSIRSGGAVIDPCRSGEAFDAEATTSTKGLSSHSVFTNTTAGTQRFDSGTAVSSTLARDEGDTRSSSTASSSGEDVVPEHPRIGSGTSFGSSTAAYEDTVRAAAKFSDSTMMKYHKTASDLTLGGTEGGPPKPPGGHPVDDVSDTQVNTAVLSKRSFTDVVRVTSSDDGGHTGAKPELVVGPETSNAGELEQCSSSYLGGDIVIPPSIPVESVSRKHFNPGFVEAQVTRTESRPQPQQEWPVIAAGRQDTAAEAAIRSPWRSRFWQPWGLCSAAGVMMLVPLAFALAPMLGSGPVGGRVRPDAPRSAHSYTSSGGRDVSARRTVNLQEVYIEDADIANTCNSTAPKHLENDSALVDGGPYRVPYKPDTDLKPQFRPVFCVFDNDLSFGRFHATVDNIGSAGFRRPLDAEFFENISASRLNGRLHHRGRRIPLYVTFGGRRSDSAEFVRMLRDPAWRKATVDGIVNETALSERPKYDGVNLDWNHPGDRCDVLKHPQLFHVLAESLSSDRVKVMLTVPPLPRYAALYDLEPLLESVSHVIVATHKLRPRGFVDCSGGRLYAALAFKEIRDSYSVAYRRKFAYSMSVGADTFVTTTVALGSTILPAPPPSGLVLRPNKTSFESVCNVAPVFVNPDDMECVMAIMQVVNSADAAKLYHVATYAGPKQLRERMHQAYADDMGDASVAVFDAHLDDFAGTCPGDSPRMSPQIAAIAEGTRRDLE